MLRFFGLWRSRPNRRRTPFVAHGDGRQYFPPEPQAREDAESTALFSETREQELRDDTIIIDGYQADALEEKAILEMLDLVESDFNIVSLSFKNCELASQVKNKLTALIPYRNFTHLAFENCGLTSEDMWWLHYIVSNAHAAQSITLIDALEHDDMVTVYQNFPRTNLRTVRLKAEHLQALIDAETKCQSLEIAGDTLLNYEYVHQLFTLIQTAKIHTLSIESSHFVDAGAYKLFMRQLREDTHLRTLTIGNCPGLEADLFALLNMQNCTLSVVNTPLPCAKIQALLARNALLNEVRTYIETSHDDDDDEHNTLVGHLEALEKLSDPGYLSFCQQEMTRLIDVLEEMARAEPSSPAMSLF